MSGIGYHPPMNTLCFDACPPPEPREKRQLKSCENCPAWFARPVVGDRCGQKYCPNCVSRMLLPPRTMEREIAEINELSGHFAKKTHIHYDDSLLPRAAQVKSSQRIDRVVALFQSKPRVTAEEIKSASGYAGTPGVCVGSMRQLGLKIKVDSYLPSIHGQKPAALYVLDGVIRSRRILHIRESDPRWMNEEQVQAAIRKALG